MISSCVSRGPTAVLRGHALIAGLALLSVVLPAPPPVAADLPAPNLVTVLLREGQLGEGDSPIDTVETIAVNHTGGYAVNVSWATPHGTSRGIWGSRQGEPPGWLTPPLAVQRYLEQGFGLGDGGELCYTQTNYLGRTVWLDDAPVLVPGTDCPTAPGQWEFAYWSGIMSGSGEPYYQGGLVSPRNKGHFSGFDGAHPIVLGGQSIPGVPWTVSTVTPVCGCDCSAFGNHVILCVYAGTWTMVKDGEGLYLGGTLVSTGNVIPVSVGGTGSEAWGLVSGHHRINEAGDYLFSSFPHPEGDQLFVWNGQILYREGSSVDGEILTGTIPGGGGALNEDGDFALRWAIEDTEPRPVVILNDRIVARGGDPVDLDGDGTADPGATLAALFGENGLSRIELTDRDAGGDVTVYFLADVDTAGTPTGVDDLACFLALRVSNPTSAPVVAAAERPCALLPNRPNPFAGPTEIRFELERPTAARLTIFDVAGRRVAVLLDDVLPAGSHTVAWSGHDGRNGSVPGGIYFVRLEADGVAQTRKMIRLGAE